MYVSGGIKDSGSVNMTFIEGDSMKVVNNVSFVATLTLAASVLLAPGSAMAFDADAAQALAKENNCFKCHAIDKTKKGPSYKKIAAKYNKDKGKEAENRQEMIKQLTTGPKVKLEDGSEEDHKIIDTKDQKAIDNLIDWIVAQ
jgi:cytochrome c